MIRVLIIGFGSIGARHFNILQSMGVSVEVISRHSSVAKYKSIQEGVKHFEPTHIIVCTETSLHYENCLEIEKLCENCLVLVEKPIFEKTYETHFKRNQYYVAYNLRFHPVIKNLKNTLIEQQLIYANVMVGSYLPNWRPNTDYSIGYSANPKKGGGVLRDLSHEIDYIIQIFGRMNKIFAVVRNTKVLNINSEDISEMILESKSGVIINLHLDYLSRIVFRNGIIHTNSSTIQFDLIENKLTHSEKGSKIYSYERNDTYTEQLKYFLSDDLSSLCGLDDANYTMKIIEAAEESQKLGKWVEL